MAIEELYRSCSPCSRPPLRPTLLRHQLALRIEFFRNRQICPCGRRLRQRLRVLDEELHRRAAGEDELPGEQPVGEAAGPIDVGTVIHRPSPERRLGSDERRRTAHDPARLYVLALTYLAVINRTAAVMHRFVAAEWPQFGCGSLALIPLAIAFSTPVQVGEEIGWRGSRYRGLPIASDCEPQPAWASRDTLRAWGSTRASTKSLRCWPSSSPHDATGPPEPRL
jgi:hypothetical protein